MNKFSHRYYMHPEGRYVLELFDVDHKRKKVQCSIFYNGDQMNNLRTRSLTQYALIKDTLVPLTEKDYHEIRSEIG